MKNIEIKIPIDNFGAIIKRMKTGVFKFHDSLKQRDTYYNINGARLKIREEKGNSPHIIFYKRPNTTTQKVSSYRIIHIKPDRLKKIKGLLKRIFGLKRVVTKSRQLWMYKHTRVHLDCVSGIGKFLELETVVRTTL